MEFRFSGSLGALVALLSCTAFQLLLEKQLMEIQERRPSTYEEARGAIFQEPFRVDTRDSCSIGAPRSRARILGRRLRSISYRAYEGICSMCCEKKVVHRSQDLLRHRTEYEILEIAGLVGSRHLPILVQRSRFPPVQGPTLAFVP